MGSGCCMEEAQADELGPAALQGGPGSSSLVQLTIWVCVSWFWIMLPVGDSYRKGVFCLYLSLVPVSLSLSTGSSSH